MRVNNKETVAFVEGSINSANSKEFADALAAFPGGAESITLDYFGCSTIEEAGKTYPEVKWLHPLAWFRCCTSMLKGNRWGEEMRNRALCLLRERLIPFVDKEKAFRA